MAKDKTQGMQRLDLRVPDHIYSQIERIAIANNLPYSPTTKPNADGSLKKDKDGNLIQPKVSVSPIIIDLINLGLKAIKEGTADKSELGDKTRHIEYQINNQIDVSDIEKKIIDTLTQKIEGLVSDELHKSIKTSTEIKDTLETMVEAKVKEVFTAIAKKLTGKYQTKQGLINWSDTLPQKNINQPCRVKFRLGVTANYS